MPGHQGAQSKRDDRRGGFQSRPHTDSRRVAIWIVCFGWLVAPTAFCAAQTQIEPTPRELLVDVSDDDLAILASDSQLELSQPTVLRVLRRLAQIDYAILARLAEPSFTPEDPATLPGRLFSLEGQVSEIRGVDVPPIADRPESGFKAFLLQLKGTDGTSCWVAACEIPNAWSEGTDLNLHAACDGYFLKWVDHDGTKTPLFATRRMAWRPASSAEGVSEDLVRLGRAGIDVGLLDWVRARVGQKLERGETMALLQLIAKSKQVFVDRTELPELDLVELLQNSRGKEGTSARMVGTVDRITPIDVSDNPYARWLGIERYYQLDMFVSIGNRRINITDKSQGDPLTFEFDYPATVIVAELPAELQHGQAAGTLVEMPVVFYRLWSFPTIMSQRVDPDRQQVAPLFVGGAPKVISASPRAFSTSVAVLVGALVVGIGLFCLWLWATGRRDRPRRALPPNLSEVRLP